MKQSRELIEQKQKYVQQLYRREIQKKKEKLHISIFVGGIVCAVVLFETFSILFL